MDEVKITIKNGATRGVLARLLTRYLKKKLTIPSLKIAIDECLIFTNSDGEIVIRVDAVASAKKHELLEKINEV